MLHCGRMQFEGKLKARHNGKYVTLIYYYVAGVAFIFYFPNKMMFVCEVRRNTFPYTFLCDIKRQIKQLHFKLSVFENFLTYLEMCFSVVRIISQFLLVFIITSSGHLLPGVGIPDHPSSPGRDVLSELRDPGPG